MIRVGLIGAGFMGRMHFSQYARMADRARVVRLCDLLEDRRRGDWSGVGGNLGDGSGPRLDPGHARPVADWREVVADPEVDMVDLCVPTDLHAGMAVAALEAGKHVLCEKPMALTVAECDRMLEAAGRCRGLLMIAQCIRFWPEYVFLREALRDGRYGAPRALQFRRQASVPTYSHGQWLQNPARSGGAILDLHVHDVDYAIGLLGRPRSLVARACARPNGSFDRVHALWDCPSVPVVQLEGFWDMPEGFGFSCGFTAVFERAALTWDLASGKPLTVLQDGRPPEAPALLATDGYYNEIAYFLDCVAAGRAPAVSTPRESRDAVAVALAEKEAAATGRAVDGASILLPSPRA